MTTLLPIDTLGSAGLRRVMVTGANGFVGRVLCRHLGTHGVDVLAVTRENVAVAGATRVSAIGDFTAMRDWAALLDGVDAIVHLAALTHDATRGAQATRFHAVNVEVTARLAAAAVARDVRRFVYLSSIKVSGESSRYVDGVLQAHAGSDTPAPEDDYGRSKLAAEQALRRAWPQALGALTILRPPLIYGAGQKGNLARLMGLLAQGWPLPVGAIRNRRSLLYVENLIDAIVLALGVAHPGLRCYTLADVDISTPDLVRALAHGLGVRARLLPVPAALLSILSHAPAIGGTLRRLGNSLIVDTQVIRSELGWRPRTDFEFAIAATCAAWRTAQS